MTKRVLLISGLIMITFGLIGYLLLTEEWKFAFRKTARTKAWIVEEHFWHFGRGYYFQEVSYEFRVNDKLYNEKFDAGRARGVQRVGDTISVEYVVGHPDWSRLYGFY